MASYAVYGRVIDTATEREVPGLRVEAWDKDLIVDDRIGSVETDAAGRFEFHFDSSAFRDVFTDREPDLFFRIFQGSTLIRSTEDSVLWNLDAGETILQIEVDAGLEPAAEARPRPLIETFPLPLPPQFDDEFGGADFDRIKRLHLTGSQPYSDRELIARRQVIQRQIDAVFAEAAQLDIAEDALFQRLGRGPSAATVKFGDAGSLGPEGLEKQEIGSSGNGDGSAPCCTGAQIAAERVRILAAYTSAVARVNKWKGCQDWSVIVQQAVAAMLGPCWSGKFVWRIRVWPFGRWTPFDSGDTFIHHAYAICPCSCSSYGGCADCLVLDPYTITGLASFQSAETAPFSDWIAAGNVWRATSNPDHDNCSIYKYTMQHYCRRSRSGGLAQRGACRAVRKLLMRELARYTGATGPTLDRLYRSCGMKPSCC